MALRASESTNFNVKRHGIVIGDESPVFTIYLDIYPSDLKMQVQSAPY